MTAVSTKSWRATASALLLAAGAASRLATGAPLPALQLPAVQSPAVQPPAVQPLGMELAAVQLHSGEWPPYSSAQLPGYGISSAVVGAALRAVGHRLDVRFYPWRRAIALAQTAPGVAGYYPEYDAASVQQHFLLSDPFGRSPIGFVERTSHPLAWQRLEDLWPYRVGVVAGYVNTDEFDRHVREQRQPVDVAADDRQNLLKLAAGRVRLALIDERVFQHLLRFDPQIRALAPVLRFNARMLESKPLHVCFRADREGERLRKLFNEGLKKIDVNAVMAEAERAVDAAAPRP